MVVKVVEAVLLMETAGSRALVVAVRVVLVVVVLVVAVLVVAVLVVAVLVVVVLVVAVLVVAVLVVAVLVVAVRVGTRTPAIQRDTFAFPTQGSARAATAQTVFAAISHAMTRCASDVTRCRSTELDTAALRWPAPSAGRRRPPVLASAASLGRPMVARGRASSVLGTKH
jgi:hypothetical protein